MNTELSSMKVLTKYLTENNIISTFGKDALVRDSKKQMIFAYDKNENGSKKYFMLPKTNENELTAIRNLLKNDFHLYELISNGIPIKFYFDLEINGKDRYAGCLNMKNDDDIFNKDGEVLKMTLNIIKDCFKSYYGLILPITSFCCSASCRPSKLSFHVVIKNTYFAENIIQAGNFAKYVSKIIQGFAERDDAYKILISDNLTIVDTTVYKTDQLMRMVNQSKRKRDNVNNEDSVKLRIFNENTIDDSYITLLNNTGIIIDNTFVQPITLPTKTTQKITCPNKKGKKYNIEKYASKIRQLGELTISKPLIHNKLLEQSKLIKQLAKTQAQAQKQYDKQIQQFEDVEQLELHMRNEVYGTEIITHHAKCENELCNKIVKNKNNYDGYCINCLVQLFPTKSIFRNNKAKETSVVEYITNKYPDLLWKLNQTIGASQRRPDMFVDLGHQIIIIEIDEHKHNYYGGVNEYNRMMDLLSDTRCKNTLFIRFNPDSYKVNETTITSCWTINSCGLCTIKNEKQDEWNARLDKLYLTLTHYMKPENKITELYQVVQLFYDGYE